MTEGIRRSGRVAKEVPILLIGSDTEGRVFSEETKTVVLSRHGAGIVSRHKLAAEDEIIIRSRESNKEAIAHVVGQIGCDNGLYSYGVAFADPNIHFWNTLLPPPTPADMVALRLAFECHACGNRAVLENAEEAADVHAINDGIVRFCSVCGYSTVWKISHDGPDAFPPAPPPAAPVEKSCFVPPTPPPLLVLTASILEEPAAPSAYSSAAIALDELPSPYTPVAPPAASVPAFDVAPKPTAPTAAGANRRKYVRARVTFAACIRTNEFGDDVGICEDISRGGLRFKSRKHYPIGTKIEVAVPYSPETQSIFVHGRVVFVQHLPEQSMTRHGVCYLSASAK
jgi:PilZ domain